MSTHHPAAQPLHGPGAAAAGTLDEGQVTGVCHTCCDRDRQVCSMTVRALNSAADQGKGCGDWGAR